MPLKSDICCGVLACLLLRLRSPAVSAAVNKQQMMEDNVHQGAFAPGNRSSSSSVAAGRKGKMPCLVRITVDPQFQQESAKVVYFICKMKVLRITYWLQSATIVLH